MIEMIFPFKKLLKGKRSLRMFGFKEGVGIFVETIKNPEEVD